MANLPFACFSIFQPMRRLSPEFVSQSGPDGARLAERDDRRGASLDAAVEEILHSHGQMDTPGDGMRGEEIEDEVAAQWKLIDVIVELHRRPAGLRAEERAVRGLERGLIARHLRNPLAVVDARVGEEPAGGESPVARHAEVAVDLHAARAAAAVVLALAGDERRRARERYVRYRVFGGHGEEGRSHGAAADADFVRHQPFGP